MGATDGSMSTPAPDPTARKLWLWFALALWLIPCLVITARVAARPLKRTVTQVYHGAVERWQEHEPLYDGHMQYLPTFVPLFAPYHALPLRVGDVLWRWTAMAALAVGLRRFARGLQGEPDCGATERAFALISLLSVPLCLGALSNGQANAHLGAALLLAALCLAGNRAWGAALFIALAVAIKPLGIAAAGLAVVCFPRLWWRVGAAILLMLGIPFLLGPWPYVQSQFVAGFENLRRCSALTLQFADLNGLLRLLGIPLGWQASMWVRTGAGAVLAVFCLALVRPRPLRERALVWLAASATYLMLFNPMTEANSYAIFGLPAAIWTWQLFQSGRRKLGCLLAAMLGTMGLLPTLLWPWLGNYFAFAWYPSMAIVFLAILLAELCRRPSPQPAPKPVPL